MDLVYLLVYVFFTHHSSPAYYICLLTTAVLPAVQVDLVDCEVGSEVDHPPSPDLLVGVGTRVPPVSRVSVTIHSTVRVTVPTLGRLGCYTTYSYILS